MFVHNFYRNQNPTKTTVQFYSGHSYAMSLCITTQTNLLCPGLRTSLTIKFFSLPFSWPSCFMISSVNTRDADDVTPTGPSFITLLTAGTLPNRELGVGEGVFPREFPLESKSCDTGTPAVWFEGPSVSMDAFLELRCAVGDGLLSRFLPKTSEEEESMW